MIENGGVGKRAALIGAVIAASLVFCTICLAAEGHEGGGHSGINLDLLARFINFALLVIILFVVLKKANIKGLLESRRQELRKRMETLRTAKEEAERKYREMEERMREFEKSRQGILERFRAEGLAEKQRLILEAEERVRQILEQAEGTIRRETEAASERLKKEMVGLAAQHAEKIIAREMTDQDQDRLVTEFIEKVGKVH